ncbi:MAG: hypothetical protein FWG89_02890 [Treponema sp.]|nr:hypothetical protein [Treponema sp.]
MASYRDRIDALHRQKLEFNEEKLRRRGGSYDTDDHGWIPLDLTRPVQRFEDPACKKCTGMEAVSRVFADYLDAHPCYAHPKSAVAGCWIGNLPYMDEGWRPEHLFECAEPLLQKYNITSRGHYAMNHSAPDLAIGLDLGWGGLLAKIRTCRARLPASSESNEFYDGEERLVKALQRYIKRTADHCRNTAAAVSDSFERQNLLNLAAMNDYLCEGAPRTLREAVQWISWYDDIDRMYFNGGAGQEIDTLLYPYYQRDRENGLLCDDEEAVWYFASMFFNDPHYHMIGGQNPVDGSDVSNALSFLVLEGQHRLGIPNNLALRIHENTNDALFTQAVKNLLEDGTGVCYSLSNGLDKGYMRNGYPAALARMRSKVGCNWTALPGIEYTLQDVTRVDLAKPLLLALDDLLSSPGEHSMERLWDLYAEHLKTIVQVIKDGVDWHVQYKRHNKPELVLNLLCHGPIERGIDMSAGGVDIVNFACDAVSLATAANSFAAIEQRVVREKRLSMEQLKKVLDANYRGYEEIRLMLKNVPQYGAGNTPADDYALRLSRLYTDLMRNTPTKDGFTVLPGIFSHGDVYKHGKNLGATPNGRFAGEPISHSADPDPGFLPGGSSAPSAKANAVARVQSGWGNSTPLQADIDAAFAKETGGIENIKAYIRAHNKMGGTLVNINVVSKEKILAAHKDPLKFPDLVVRVTGYSAFFRSLSPEYRQQVVDRWLAM